MLGEDGGFLSSRVERDGYLQRAGLRRLVGLGRRFVQGVGRAAEALRFRQLRGQIVFSRLVDSHLFLEVSAILFFLVVEPHRFDLRVL